MDKRPAVKAGCFMNARIIRKVPACFEHAGIPAGSQLLAGLRRSVTGSFLR